MKNLSQKTEALAAEDVGPSYVLSMQIARTLLK
jgi:hypothetical protein